MQKLSSYFIGAKKLGSLKHFFVELNLKETSHKFIHSMGQKEILIN